MPVVAAAPVSLTVKGIGGQLVTLNVAKARIAMKTRGTLRNIRSGSRFLRCAGSDSGELAGTYEVIVLPEDSALGT